MDQVNAPQHRELAAGKWESLTFAEQMANCGSEVFRAIRWQEKRKPALAEKAYDRALELLDFTIAAQSGRSYELLRLREVLCDYFVGANEYRSTPDSLNRYFDFFSQKAAGIRANRN